MSMEHKSRKNKGDKSNVANKYGVANNSNSSLDGNCYPAGRNGGCCPPGMAGSPYCYHQPGTGAACPPAAPGAPYGGCNGYQCVCAPDTFTSQSSLYSSSDIYARQRALCYDDPCDRTVFDPRAPNPVPGCPSQSYDCKRRTAAALGNYSLGYPSSTAVHSFDCPNRGRPTPITAFPPSPRNYEYGLYDCSRGGCQHRY